MNLNKYVFYYDESGHSRKISKETIEDKEFKENFVVSIVGLPKEKAHQLELNYCQLEEEYRPYFQLDEIKSTVFKKAKYKHGLASFKPKDIEFLNKLFDLLIKYDAYLYFFVSNKIEWIVVQLLKQYFLNPIYNAVSIEYALTKLISLYKPEAVINAIYNKDPELTKAIKEALCAISESHKGIEQKAIENEAIKQLLQILNKCNTDVNFEWKYIFSFDGFKDFLNENNISEVELIIDREGNGKTIGAAIKSGLDAIEADSKEMPIIRIADMLSGVINNFLDSIGKSVGFKPTDNPNKLKVLGESWFKLTGEQYKCYQKLKTVFIDQHNTYNKISSSRYQDYLLYFICLLNYIISFDSPNMIVNNIGNCSIELNTYVIESLGEEYKMQNDNWLRNVGNKR